MKKLTTRKAAAIVVAAALVGLFAGAAPSAAQNPGNAVIECEEAWPGSTLVARFGQDGGVYTFEGPAGNEAVVTLSNETEDGADFDSTELIGGVIVKASTAHNLIPFDPAVLSGSFSNGDIPHAVSHVDFCSDFPRPTTTTAAPTTTTVKPTTTVTAAAAAAAQAPAAIPLAVAPSFTG